MNKVVLYKIILLVCIIFWITAIIITWNSPATGYESSIYRSTPLIFWAANIVSLIVGIIFIVKRSTADDKTYHESFLAIVGIILVFLVFASVLSVWIIRGYSLWSQHDSLTHLGIINQMLTSGYFESSNFYPITHIYVVELSLLLNVATENIVKLVPFIFTLFSIVFFYCFSKTVLKEQWQAILATLIWMAFLTDWYIDLTPNMLSNFIFPLGLFLVMKSLLAKDAQWKTLLMIFICLIPLFHTLVGFVTAAFMLAIWVFHKIFVRKKLPISAGNSVFVLISTIVLLAWTIVWASLYGPLNSLYNNIIRTISGEITTNLNSLLQQAQYASGYDYNLLEFFLRTYTGPTIVILFALVGIIVLLVKQRRRGYPNSLILYISPLFVMAGSFIALYLVATGFPPERFIIYILLACVLFVGFIFYNILQYQNRFLRRTVGTGIVLVVTLLFILGGLKLYPSPYTYQPNMQVTSAQIDGMRWFIFNKDITQEQTSLTVRTYRFGSLFLTPEEVSKRPDMRYFTANIPDYLIIPLHFGYNVNTNLGQSFRDDTYLVLSRECRLLYEDIRPEMSALRFQDTDFAKIEDDTTVNKLYSAGTGLDIYYIQQYPN